MYSPKTKFLVVDDMTTMRKLVTKALRDMGYSEFIEAEDGQKAWEVLNSPNSNGVQFVISDWNMPNCSGLDLLKRVRKDGRVSGIPFMLLTAESEQSQVVEAITSGVDNYIMKPFTKDTLTKKIQEVYAKKPQAA